MTPEHIKDLDQLMQETAMRTRKELVNNALALFAWAVKATQEGRVVASVDPATHSYKEILLPALENVATLRHYKSSDTPATEEKAD
jgi:hypothetical protein